MTLDTLAPEAPFAYSDTPDAVVPPEGAVDTADAVDEKPVDEKPKKAPAKKSAG